MRLEEIYTDLYAIAGHVGPLDEDAVRGATTMLALPRYAGRPELLVKDLKRVIEDVPADTRADQEDDEGDPASEWASRYFQSYARRYFSLDASGEMLSRRRSFGRTSVKGTVITWMNRGVVYRVAAGLLELWGGAVDSDAEDARETPVGLSYRIDSVKATRKLANSWLFPTRDVLEYDLCLLAPGPHVLLLPFPTRHTTLVAVSTDRAIGKPKPQLVSIADEEIKLAAVLFGAQQQSGECVLIQVEHRTMRARNFGPQHHVRSSYQVIQPVGQLTLAVNPRSPYGYKWQVSAKGQIASDPTIIDAPSHPHWSCDNPDVGSRYHLSGRLRTGNSPYRPDEKEREQRVRILTKPT